MTSRFLRASSSASVSKLRQSATPGLVSLHEAFNAHVRRDRQSGADAISFFYYSGHWAADGATNYLIPVDVTKIKSALKVRGGLFFRPQHLALQLLDCTGAKVTELSSVNDAPALSYQLPGLLQPMQRRPVSQRRGRAGQLQTSGLLAKHHAPPNNESRRKLCSEIRLAA